MKQTVVLTGARGFLGSEVLRALVQDSGFEVVALCRPGGHVADWEGMSISVDLADGSSLAETLARLLPYAVVHAAGRVHGTVLELFRDNTVATVNLADAIARSAPGCRMIVLGSAAEYGRPAHPGPMTEAGPYAPSTAYGHSKLAGSRYLAAAHRQQGLQYDELVVFNVVGDRNSRAQVIGAFIAKAAGQIEAGEPGTIRMGPLGAIRDFVTVNDVARIVLAVLKGPPRNGPMNVCSGRGRRIRDLLQLLIEESGAPLAIEEQGSMENAAELDVVIGDPRLCLAALAPQRLECVDETLRRAWRLAVANPA